jgi:transcriptional regulator with XRE-family HTH domain
MEKVPQAPMQEIDLSIILRQIMAARRLSVAEVADAAGVSKSAMEKYLSGPSSPRLVALASLSRALDLSMDRIVFGEIDPNEELVFTIAFREMRMLISDLKSDGALWDTFSGLEARSDALSDFAHELAYVRAVQMRNRFREHRRQQHFQQHKIVAL